MKNNELHKSARNILASALQDCDSAPLPEEEICELIDTIIEGSHKTYRYILFTAITAKAADSNLNPLVLQKKANTWGTYDARSLCHKVLVPFEREHLNNSLGGSNEPFLNKPARFEMLSLDNAVRNGNDKKLLNLLCVRLPKIKSDAEAWAALCYLMRLLRKKAEAIPERFIEVQMERGGAAIEIRSFLDCFLEHNNGGEVLTLALAGILNEFLTDDPTYRIEVHNLNQSGASSREISDLDLYRNEKIFALFELKDKDFDIPDIQHAVRKAIEGGCDSLNFIYGRFASFDSQTVQSYRTALIEDSFCLNVFPIDAFIDSLLIVAPSLNLGRMINYMLNTAESCHFSTDTSSLLLDIGKDFEETKMTSQHF
ncbi:restriction endonuclease, SacI family [Actinomyces vulturis]|uniref:restriction endonuclease, SacI family n=1 Tax=Actinomyces vulturis TaxID=1857645 RepID=UPI00082A6AC9|nr:restriction endonuclease, SacI family [Actinomyces vulturis]